MASVTVSKNIGELSNGTVLFVEWKIRDFLSLPHEVGHRILSPSFYFEGAIWYLRLFPNGDIANSSAGNIDLYLVKRYSASPIHPVNFYLGISNNDGTVYNSLRGEDDFEENEIFHGVDNLVERSAVGDEDYELTLNGVATFFCYLQVKSRGTSDASTQTTFLEGAHKLATNLKDLLLSKEDCDIVLKVKNQEFQAHKTILVSRSSVFSSMFRHEMTEKLSGVVNIPDCDPDAFQLFLIYLYTGTAECLSSSNVFNVYAIANKYEATDLKIKCTEYMKNNLSVENVCDVITTSLLHNELDLLDMASDFFTKRFNDIIITVKWQCFLQENSTAANELLIRLSKVYVPPK